MKRLIPLLLLALALSACTIRLDLALEVNEDESGTFALFMGFDEEFQELMAQGGGDDLSLTEGLEDVPEGWTVEETVEDGFEGVKITTDFDSFEDLDAKLSELNEGQDAGMGTDFLSDFGLTHDGDEFRFEADVSGVDDQLSGALGESDGGEDLLGGMDPSSLIGDLFEIRFRLTMPGTIEEHNADAIDGNTLTWNLDLADEGGTFEAVSTTGGGSSALLLGGAAVAAAVVVGVGVTAVRRRKNSPEELAIAAAAPVPPSDPVS